MREGLKRICHEVDPSGVVGEAATRAEALDRIRAEAWDMVVLDISLHGASGLEVLKDIELIRPATPVLVLSMHSEEQYARRAIRAGAAGYITKDSPRAALVTALQTVLRGGRYVSPALAERMVFDFGRESDRAAHETLSDREFEVLRLLGSGKTVGEIADLLALSDKTVSTYRARILEKMRMRTNADIVRYVIENSLIA